MGAFRRKLSGKETDDVFTLEKENAMKRALVIGSPGAGKSTFAGKLHAVTGLPLYHLDTIWHLPDRTNVPREEFDRRLAEILSDDEWIIDGNYARTLEMRLKRCDTVFLLDYPVEVCLQGAAERIGRRREDMPWTEKTFDGGFRRYIEDFPGTQRPVVLRLLNQYGAGRRIVILRSRKEAVGWLDKVYGYAEGE